MYPSEAVNADDFLLTCHRDYVHLYRQPMIRFIGPQNIRKHGVELQNVVEETVLFWGEKSHGGKINATELFLAFTTTVISRLLLGHPGPFETYREIAFAIDYLNKYVMKKTWRQPISNEEKKRYEQSLAIVRQAIETSSTTLEKPLLGHFLDALREEKLTELQIRTTLLVMYLGGSETAASLLNYFLWQLGQHLEYQEEILQEMKGKEGSLFDVVTSLKSLDRLFAESIRLFTPAYVIGRQLASNLGWVCKDDYAKITH
jgi:cytochrome P450